MRTDVFSRRDFLRFAGIAAVGAGTVRIFAGESIQRVRLSGKPNIVLIFADDMGWKDVGYNGSDFYETPHIDRMAQEGMVFHQAYMAAANCAPSRACLISGAYTPRHHVYAVGSTARGPKHLQRLVPIPNKSGLSRNRVTIADALQAGGYATAIFGKWHLAGPDGAEPGEQGFGLFMDSQEGNPNTRRDRPDDPKGIHSITRAACDFMEQCTADGKPFFAYVSHHAIHGALEARPETIRKFEAKTPGKQHRHPLYAACTYDFDEGGVGRLLAKIKSLGIENNTLVIFTSDNGATPQSCQEPLRGNKGGYYEGGIRVPFIAWWPGVIKAGSESDVPVIAVDLYPTFLGAGGIEPPEDAILDGENLIPLLKGQQNPGRLAIFWHFPGYLSGPVKRGRPSDVRLRFRTRPVSVIRKGDWKLHLFHEEWQLDGGGEKLDTNGAVELYNLSDDPGEHHNRALANTVKRDEMLKDLLDWFSNTEALLPTKVNTAYDASTAETMLNSVT